MERDQVTGNVLRENPSTLKSEVGKKYSPFNRACLIIIEFVFHWKSGISKVGRPRCSLFILRRLWKIMFWNCFLENVLCYIKPYCNRVWANAWYKCILCAQMYACSIQIVHFFLALSVCCLSHVSLVGLPHVTVWAKINQVGTQSFWSRIRG